MAASDARRHAAGWGSVWPLMMYQSQRVHQHGICIPLNGASQGTGHRGIAGHRGVLHGHPGSRYCQAQPGGHRCTPHRNVPHTGNAPHTSTLDGTAKQFQRERYSTLSHQIAWAFAPCSLRTILQHYPRVHLPPMPLAHPHAHPPPHPGGWC